MGFGHRVYRAYDPRAAALRKVAEGMEHRPDWLRARDRGRGRRPAGPRREAPRAGAQDNVEFYAAPVLMGVGLAPDLFPATFSLARHAGWTAHALEQAADNRLIRPDVNYVGPGGARPPGIGLGYLRIAGPTVRPCFGPVGPIAAHPGPG